MSNVTANQSPLIKAQVFSEFMLEHIADGALPDGLHRDVSDFGDGDTLYIPVMGETVLRDYIEDSSVEFDALDTGQIMLTITEYVSAASCISDKLKQDGYKAAVLEQAIPKEHLRLIKERMETDLLAQANKQTLSSPNLINGIAHRWVAGSGVTTGVLTLEDFAYAKLAADRANMPEQGRIAIVDAIVGMTLDVAVGAQGFINNPMFEGIATTGFVKGKRFLRNISGWDVYVCNRLPTVTETITGGPHASSKGVTAGKVNVFGCFADDQHTPFMGAVRAMPSAEGFRNATRKRDEYSTTARWGFGLQRPESLISILSSATAYK